MESRSRSCLVRTPQDSIPRWLATQKLTYHSSLSSSSMTRLLEPLSRDPSAVLFWAGFDGQPVVDWNDHHGKWCSSVVAHLRE
jgi:hypothetical protein